MVWGLSVAELTPERAAQPLVFALGSHFRCDRVVVRLRRHT